MLWWSVLVTSVLLDIDVAHGLIGAILWALFWRDHSLRLLRIKLVFNHDFFFSEEEVAIVELLELQVCFRLVDALFFQKLAEG